ncbi:MAG: hypothetical protein ACREH5_03215 [Candidatus Omnitrophota bacterium]
MKRYIGVVAIPRALAVTQNLKASRAASFLRSAARKLTRANVTLLRGLVARNRALATAGPKAVGLEVLPIVEQIEEMDRARKEMIRNVCPNIRKLGG